MREILFRAKGTSGYSANKWVYGYYCKDFWNPRTGHGILPTDKECGGYVEVDPETVGQFTGLTDKNGKKIFEGDIVRYMNKETMVVVWNKDSASFAIAYSSINFNYLATLSSAHIYLEVIGNIHENPELLGGAEDG